MSEMLTFKEILHLSMTNIRGMWRHRGQMLAITWIICITGWFVISMMEDQYISSARVLIEDPKGQVTTYIKQMTDFPLDITEEARRVLTSLLNRANLEQVLKASDLERQISSPEEREHILAELSQQVTITPIGRGSNVYKIAHTHINPAVTRQVVDGLLNILETGMAKPMGTQQNRMAQEFLAEQIKDYEAKLAESDELLQQFKKKNAEILPGEGGYYKRLKDILSEVEKEKVKLREQEKRRAELQRQFTSLTGHAPVDDANSGQLIDQKIRDIHAKIEEMLNRYYMRGDIKRPLYSESHPEIVALHRQIAQLEQQKQDRGRSKESRNEIALMELDNDPVMRQIKVSISSVDVDIASSRGRIEELQHQIDELRSMENTIPTVEAELIRLERNVTILREKLLNLLETQGKVTLGGDMAEGLSKHVRFRILDRPNTPVKPAGPNRPLFLSAVLFGGIAAGLILSLLLSIMRPVFDSPASIKKELGLPVLGTVSMMVDGRKNSWLLSPTIFFSLLGGLILIYLMFLLPRL